MNSKKKTNWSLIIVIILDIVAGLIYSVPIADSLFDPDNIFSLVIIYLVFIVSYVIGNYLGVAFHEAGHLVFGLLTGYRLLSYRVGSLLITKKDGKLVFSRYSIPGTAGQCLMDRPVDRSNRSYFWYNAGGVIFNLLLVAVVHLVLLLPVPGFIRCALLVIAFTNWTLVLSNGIPVISSVSNDGMNIVEMSRHPSSITVFQNSLEITRKQLEGLRMKDLDDSYILRDDETLYAGGLGFSSLILLENKLMDLHEFDKVRDLIKEIREKNYPVLPLHQQYLTIDEKYLDCLEGKYQNDEDKKLQKLIKAGDSLINVQRFLYARALLTGDNELLQKVENNFNKIKKNYPFKGDLETELELVEVAKERLSPKEHD